jgi:hypothetical protein
MAARWEKDIEAAEREIAKADAEQYGEDIDSGELIRHMRILIDDLREMGSHANRPPGP